MKKALIAGVLVGLIGLGGFAAWWKVTAFERVATRALDDAFASDDDWVLLHTRPDDPRVLRLARSELHDAVLGTQPNTVLLERAVTFAGPILERHPADDDALLADVAALITREGDARPMRWTRRPPEDLVEAMAAGTLAVADGRVKVLEVLRPRASVHLLTVLLLDSARGAESLAARHLAAGVPEDGAPFVPLTEPTDRVNPANDARITAAVARRLHACATVWCFAPDVAGLTRALEKAPAPPLDATIVAALVRAIEVPDVAGLAARLVGPADVELVRAHAPASALPMLLGTYARPGDLEALYGELREAFARAAELNERARAQLDQRVDARVAQVVGMGPAAVPALEAGLRDSSWGVRQLASKALERLDRPAWATAVAGALRDGQAGWYDARLALVLGQREPLQVEALFGCFAVGDEALTREAGDAVRRAVGPEVWVAGLFDNLATGARYPAASVNAYQAMLSTTAGAAPHIARALQRQLDAAGGQASAVSWLTKVLALEALLAAGTSAERGVVQRFTKDPTAYERMASRYDRASQKTLTQKTDRVFFSELAGRALAAIDGRR